MAKDSKSFPAATEKPAPKSPTPREDQAQEQEDRIAEREEVSDEADDKR